MFYALVSGLGSWVFPKKNFLSPSAQVFGIHKIFLGFYDPLLLSNDDFFFVSQGCHSMFAQLLIDLFKFLAPFLRNAEMAKPVQTLYKGTLRVLLVLLHDFPEFLCDYHYAFCDVIPSNCIQVIIIFIKKIQKFDFSPKVKIFLFFYLL